MTITINNLTVGNSVPEGTIIGTLTTWDAAGNEIPCTYVLTKNSAGYFAISGDQLITAWSAPAALGYYSVRVRAMGTTMRFSGSATFPVDVVMTAPTPPPPPAAPAPPPPPPPPPPSATPTQITLSPATFSVPDNSPAGTVLATVSVTMSDGSAFTGQLSTAPSVITISGNNVVLARALTSADDGIWSGTMVVEATQNNTSIVQYLYGAVTPASPTPPPAPAQPIITVTPSNPTIPDTTALGAVVATFSVTMSDGSPFTGTVGFAAPYYNAGGIFAISGNNIVVDPSGPGVGPNSATLTEQITLEAIE